MSSLLIRRWALAFTAHRRNFSAWVVSIALIGAPALTACHRGGRSGAPAITIEHEVTPLPARVGPSTVALKISNASGKSVEGAHISVEGDMSHAGMAPVFAEAKETSPGQYQAPLKFSMAGDWVVLLHITLAGGKKVEEQFDVKGVRPD